MLDLGCGDGRFTQKVLDQITGRYALVAVDGSKTMVELTRERLKKYQRVTVTNGIVGLLSFLPNSFDLIYSRRGPTLNRQQNILSDKGYYLELRVGEDDTAALQTVFGRGQFYPKRSSAVFTLKKIFSKSWKIIEIKEYHYRDYFRSLGKLARYLTMTPSIPEFNPQKEKKFLTNYAMSHHDNKGIYLDRHRVILLAQRTTL